MKSTLELRDYQEEISDKAVELLKKYRIAYLAMQVRTGKTLTAMATAYKFGAKSVLFVTKKKAISDIVNQFSGIGIEMGIYVTNY
jgi:superfamily II DNA or RNA helicase